jgi:hypothetical protein
MCIYAHIYIKNIDDKTGRGERKEKKKNKCSFYVTAEDILRYLK